MTSESDRQLASEVDARVGCLSQLRLRRPRAINAASSKVANNADDAMSDSVDVDALARLIGLRVDVRCEGRQWHGGKARCKALR